MMKKLFAALAVAAACGSASATVMDFDSGAAFNDSNGSFVYSEDGYTWAPTNPGWHIHLESTGTGSGLNNHGGGCCSNPYILTSNSNAAFSLVSMFVQYATDAMEFVGSNSSVETIAAGFTGLYTFTGMNNVTSVTWNLINDVGASTIDNLTIGRVPEPLSPLLLGVGIAALGLARRKERKE
jgi:hypothetical protein